MYLTAGIQARVERYLGGCLRGEEFAVRLVRDVAPNKRMLCVTFRIPESVAFASNASDSQASGSKRRKVAAPDL